MLQGTKSFVLVMMIGMDALIFRKALHVSCLHLWLKMTSVENEQKNIENVAWRWFLSSYKKKLLYEENALLCRRRSEPFPTPILQKYDLGGKYTATYSPQYLT